MSKNLLSITDDSDYLKNLTLSKDMKNSNPLLYGILAAISFVIVFIIMLWILTYAWNESVHTLAGSAVGKLTIISAFWLVVAIRILFH